MPRISLRARGPVIIAVPDVSLNKQQSSLQMGTQSVHLIGVYSGARVIPNVQGTILTLEKYHMHGIEIPFVVQGKTDSGLMWDPLYEVEEMWGLHGDTRKGAYYPDS